MIGITIGKKKYKGIYRWDEMTLQKFCDLAAIPMPEGYENYIIADGKFSSEHIDKYIEEVSKITDEQLNVTFPAYYRKVIACLTDIPPKQVMSLADDKANELYDSHFKPFVISLVYHTPVIHCMAQIRQYEPARIKRFRLGFSYYYLPETVTVMDQIVPLAKEPIITYTEASDIFKGMKVSKEDVNRLALFMAIYCRKKGERYDEQKALIRKDLFMKAPMSVVWSVFFYTVRRLPDYSMTIQLFGKLQRTIQETVRQVRNYKSMAAEGLYMNVPGMVE